jgi:nicotinate-nucleotide adenylyltransferase
MRIGLMGGTFNPVHLAHLRIAEEARQACNLDRVVFIPAGDPPHKPLAGQVPFARRYEMVRLALADHPGFELSPMEGERPGRSYSIHTIRAFREMHPDDELFFIIGSDSFLELGLWYQYEEIIRACNLIVVERPGSRVPDPLAALPVAIRDEFSYTSADRRLDHRQGTTVQFISGMPLDISSSAVRRLAAIGHPIGHLVPAPVAAYIMEQRMYRLWQEKRERRENLY